MSGIATAPALSIVIAAWNGAPALRQCLASLQSQIAGEDCEVIVVSNFSKVGIEDLFDSFPSLNMFCLPAATVPELRACGIEKAGGDIVALLEDHCTFDRHWFAQIKEAHKLPYSVIGGAVENAAGMLLSWAVYFYDYGKYMLPDAGHVVTSLSGNNVSFKKPVLREVRDHYENGFYEASILEELQRRGYQLYLIPSAIVYHNKDYALKSAIADSYHHGRLFAARRVSGAPLAQRVFRGATSFLLPVLLPLRIAMRTLRKKRHVRQLAMSFPYLLVLMTAWSCGEFCGYAWSEGASARHWK